MNNQEAIEILSAYYEMDDDRQNVALDMAISALQAQDVPDTNVGDMISRQAAISELMEWVEKEEKKSWSTFKGLFHWTGVKAMLECLPPAQPEPLLDEIVDEIRKTIAETESNGKYHADSVRHNGEMICHGLQIALNIIEEKRNERSD